jgi:hypothetical protein
LEGNTRRAIDIHEGEKVNASAFKALVKAAVAQHGPAKETKTLKAKPRASKAKPAKTPLRRQSTNCEGRRRCSGAELHRYNAGLEARRRTLTRRAYRAKCSLVRGANCGIAME